MATTGMVVLYVLAVILSVLSLVFVFTGLQGNYTTPLVALSVFFLALAGLIHE